NLRSASAPPVLNGEEQAASETASKSGHRSPWDNDPLLCEFGSELLNPWDTLDARCARQLHLHPTAPNLTLNASETAASAGASVPPSFGPPIVTAETPQDTFSNSRGAASVAAPVTGDSSTGGSTSGPLRARSSTSPALGGNTAATSGTSADASQAIGQTPVM